MCFIFQVYIQLSKTYYKAEPHKVSFKTALEQSRKEINTWVEKQTEGKLNPTQHFSSLIKSACHLLWAGALASPHASAAAAARSRLAMWTVSRDAVGGQRKSSTFKQLQIPDPDLSEFPEETPVSSAVLFISWSSSTAAALMLHPCITGREGRGEKHLCLPVYSKTGGNAYSAVPFCTS